MFSGLGCISKQVKDLVPGDIICQPIHRSDGLLLINKNKQLSASMVKLIKTHASLNDPVLIAKSHVMEELDDSLTSQNNIPEEHFPARILSNNPLWGKLESKLESEKLKQRAVQAKQELLDFIEKNQSFNTLLNMMRNQNDILLINSVNTVCISLIIGLTVELNVSELLDLSIAAAFSNIGFLEMPKEDFKNFLKEENNNKYLKTHLTNFTKIAKNLPYLQKKSIIHGVLEHHEYMNGKGWPNGKKGLEISLFGRVLCLAQTYDDLVGGYKYTDGLSPIEALKIILQNKENHLDQGIISTFLNRTSYFKLGETFVFRDQLGEIIGFSDYLRKPYLPIIRLENGKIFNLLSSV